jgi:IstB-like ATP binding protein
MTAALSRLAEPAADAAIAAAAKTLQLPTIRAQFGQLATAAAKQRLSHKAFLAEVLTAECDEREARRRIRLVQEAKFPRTKRLADFDHTRIPDLTPSRLGPSRLRCLDRRRRTVGAARGFQHPVTLRIPFIGVDQTVQLVRWRS